MTEKSLRPLPPEDYRRLGHARAALADFQRQGERRARHMGLTHSQHHLLLVVHAQADPGPGVGEVAEQLGVRDHSAAGLVDRTVTAGYLHRHPHPRDGRRVQLHLTELAQRHLPLLSRPQLADLDQLVSRLTG